MRKVTFVTTWGTIDKDYWVWKWIYDIEPSNPVAWEILDKNKVNRNYETIEVLRKDSLDITDKDRLKIKQTVKNVKNDKIIITHWTDTMIQTWKYLKDIKGKIIILVGAARPYKMKETDAEFNLGFALWALEILSQIKKYWVYIAMNWELFNIDEVEKQEDGTFKRIDN